LVVETFARGRLVEGARIIAPRRIAGKGAREIFLRGHAETGRYTRGISTLQVTGMSKQARLFLLSALAASTATAPVLPPPAVTLHDTRIAVELATDETSREHGLMGRHELAPDHGMLFVFADAQPRWFWMRDTLIPLDILYFDGSRKLVSMQLDVPPCKADPCATYPSDKPARYVLELSAGTARRIGAQVGDVLAIDADLSGLR
jgi:uncharacterized membrane protein (UPF0127 family)